MNDEPCKNFFFTKYKKYPGVAELAYATDLKSVARKGLGVRLPSPGPNNQILRRHLIMLYIYKIANTLNGKTYIGKTSFTIESRWKEHCGLPLLNREESYQEYCR